MNLKTKLVGLGAAAVIGAFGVGLVSAGSAQACPDTSCNYPTPTVSVTYPSCNPAPSPTTTRPGPYVRFHRVGSKPVAHPMAPC